MEVEADEIGVVVVLTIDPAKGCLQWEEVIGIVVCEGNKKKVFQLIIISVVVVGVLAVLMVFSILRAMRYRKDLIRFMAQFKQVWK